MKFNLGDKVHKSKGYTFRGVVVAAFLNLSKEERYVIEVERNCNCADRDCVLDSFAGMLHIFSGEQLELSR